MSNEATERMDKARKDLAAYHKDFPKEVSTLRAIEEVAGEMAEAAYEILDKAQVLRVNCGAVIPTHPTDKVRMLEDMKALLDAEDGLSDTLSKYRALLNTEEQNNG